MSISSLRSYKKALGCIEEKSQNYTFYVMRMTYQLSKDIGYEEQLSIDTQRATIRWNDISSHLTQMYILISKM